MKKSDSGRALYFRAKKVVGHCILKFPNDGHCISEFYVSGHCIIVY